MMRDTLLQGDCRDLLKTLPDNSVDCCITDPPYGLGEVKDIAGLTRAWLQDEDDSAYTGKSGFMGQVWDAGVPSPRYWREVYRVLKPGGHVLCFAGTRTQDLMGLSLRLSGFQYRDEIQWVYGSGFPKSHNISAAIDHMQGAKREKVRIPASQARNPKAINGGHGIEGGDRPWMKTALANGYHDMDGPNPVTPEAQYWQGYGTALKPAHEPILLFRKPLSEPSIAANVLYWRTGSLNIDGCRVESSGEETGRLNQKGPYTSERTWNTSSTPAEDSRGQTQGRRWPANLLLSHSDTCDITGCADDCPVATLDEQAGTSTSRSGGRAGAIGYHGNGTGASRGGYDDQGGPTRFFPVFYSAKAGKKEREAGCETLPLQQGFDKNTSEKIAHINHISGETTYSTYQPSGYRNAHPTVKPLALMRWLVRLVTPPDGTVLDPFAGSGSTLVACVHEGVHYLGIEQDASYVEIAQARLRHAAGLFADSVAHPLGGADEYPPGA